MKIKELPPNQTVENLAFIHPKTGQTCYWRSQWGYFAGKAGVWYSDEPNGERIYSIHLDSLKEVLEWEVAPSRENPSPMDAESRSGNNVQSSSHTNARKQPHVAPLLADECRKADVEIAKLKAENALLDVEKCTLRVNNILLETQVKNGERHIETLENQLAEAKAWVEKIQLVNRRSDHFNSVIETFCAEALSGNTGGKQDE